MTNTKYSSLPAPSPPLPGSRLEVRPGGMGRSPKSWFGQLVGRRSCVCPLPDHYQRTKTAFLRPETGRPVLPRNTRSGFSDVVSRLKLNIWGNDGGKTALSVSGNVKFPTASDELGNGQYEGGPSMEFAAQIPWVLSCELMVRQIFTKMTATIVKPQWEAF